ncbi:MULTISPECIES: SDR family NAD(P)-dependent oxidoreductase [unclassified Nocardia]|uniref:SDR family NAD(P)-dependent oxidoreductase n=1 Tax=unclassified Nocardia TaxID=2637762 RepID=UPI001CE49A26|nr:MULTISPECIES: SDR family oxidoreductase [unclassified Nocardia]
MNSVKSALITGATGGLGYAMAVALADNGIRVAVTGRDPERARLVAEKLPGAIGLGMDVRDEASVAAAVDEAWERFGGIDMLVNNAGIGMRTIDPGFLVRPHGFWNIAPAAFRDLVETNLTGYFLVAREMTPRMLAAGTGRIVNVSVNHMSMLRAGFAPYGPSRAGTESLSRIMAAELADTPVRVNILLPGSATRTGMFPDEVPDGLPVLEPEVMGPSIVWLASDAAAEVHNERITAMSFEEWLAEYHRVS